MDPIDIQYRRIRQKYPDAPELDIWHGVAIDFYIRQGTIPTEVLVQSALARAEGYDYKYRPDQLRVPAGNPDGGQWTDEGGGGGTSTRDRVARNKPPKDKKPIASDAPAQPVRATDSSPRMLDEVIDQEPSPFDGAEITPAAGEGGYKVDLEEQERGDTLNRRGHTIEKHVGQSRTQIAEQIRENQIRRMLTVESPYVGSFRNLEEATNFVNEALRGNGGIVQDVIDGVYGDRPVAVFKDLNFPTGIEGFADPSNPDIIRYQDTRAVTVIIQRSQNRHGFRVITSFPSNKRN